jgi:uncharacterized protein (DUF2267 family)
MNEHEFFERVSRHSGLEEGPELQRFVSAALRALGEGLTAAEVALLDEELPPRLAESLREVEHGQARDLDSVLTRLCARTGVRPGIGLEQLGIVAETLAEEVRPEVMDPIRRALPWRLGRLFLPPPEPREAPAHHDARRRTLAEAPAASSRPLYASGPDAGQSDSVATSSNPHEDTKLSSAHGLTQEREEETLATTRR